jgi:hypothetical protein
MTPFALLDRSYDLSHALELVPLAALKRHPRNYQTHPQDEIDHLMASLQQHGWYKNIVIARDNTILAGHGLVEAAEQIGLTQAAALRMDLDPGEAEALAIVAGDNEIGRLSLRDESALVRLLHDVQVLAGTGYDEAMLRALAESSGVTPPAFDPVGIDEQGRLDQKQPFECPACGHTWTP